ncbi:hypothetical protein N7G274_004559 [Stereocaulon virgatum]|uniref:SET domain-containing protein n=1 Tax=Stereocaulon virgatum TaxID=373712 RepID=A0ABR4AAK3_9LECA
MATEIETITATPSVSTTGCVYSPTPLRQTSPTARQGGKRKNHHGGKKNKKKPGTKTQPQTGNDTENNDNLAEIVGSSWTKPAKEQKSTVEKKEHIEKANGQPGAALEPIEFVSAKAGGGAAIDRQSKMFSRLAVIEALELKLEAGCDEAVGIAGKDSLVNCWENDATEASGQETQDVANKSTFTHEDKSVSSDLEQGYAKDCFSNSPDQHKFDTGKEEVASRVWEYTTIAAGQDFDVKETVVTTAKEEDRGDTATIGLSNHDVNEDNEELEKDNTSSKAVDYDKDIVANHGAAASQGIPSTSKQDCACVTTNETIGIDAPRDTGTTVTQFFTQAEAEDAATAAAEKAEDSDSTVTPYRYTVREHVPPTTDVPPTTAEKKINAVLETSCLAPKDVEVEDHGSVVEASIMACAEAAISPKPDLPLPNKLYEIKIVTNKGIGMFATHFIPRGTRILREPPLLLLEKCHGEEIYHVPLKFQQLSPTAQASYLSLAATTNAERDPGRLEWLQILSATSIHAELDLSMDIRQRILQIFETNSFSADAGSAIVYEASRMNHSCTPNVYHNWNAALGERGELTVHAIRDILPGEEILTSYINICAYQFARQEQLNRYGFQCDCAACDMQTQFGRDSEERRRRLCVVNRKVVERCLWPGRSEMGDDGGTLDAVVEIIELLRAEGVVHMELTRHYRLAYPITAMLGNFAQACIWAEKAVELTRICTGTDYASYAQDEENLRMLVERARSDEMMGL